jgi:hypothetical protein
MVDQISGTRSLIDVVFELSYREKQISLTQALSPLREVMKLTIGIKKSASVSASRGSSRYLSVKTSRIPQ